jgi:septal ring factor EnvC (AmiA/AmiB activator)
LNPNEIAIYAAETKAIVQILWGLLLIVAITLVAVSVLYVLLRLKVRSERQREAQLMHGLAVKSEEIARLEARVAELTEIEEGVEELKAEVRRADAIRGKSEKRLQEQNAELDGLRKVAAQRMAELERLRKIVEHVDTGFDP